MLNFSVVMVRNMRDIGKMATLKVKARSYSQMALKKEAYSMKIRSLDG